MVLCCINRACAVRHDHAVQNQPQYDQEKPHVNAAARQHTALGLGLGVNFLLIDRVLGLDHGILLAIDKIRHLAALDAQGTLEAFPVLYDIRIERREESEKMTDLKHGYSIQQEKIIASISTVYIKSRKEFCSG